MSDPIPVYEAKNRLPFYLRKAESDGPVCITRHDKPAGYIISLEDYQKLVSAQKKQSITELIAASRKEYNLTDDDFDYTGYFENCRDRTTTATKSEKEFLQEFSE